MNSGDDPRPVTLPTSDWRIILALVDKHAQEIDRDRVLPIRLALLAGVHRVRSTPGRR